MVKVIKVNNLRDLEKGIEVLKNLRRKLPLMSSEIMNKWGKTLERDMKKSARNAGIKPHTGELFDTGIQWRQKSTTKSKTGFLFIRDYGVKLDSMNPHWVNITPNRNRFLRWGLQADSSSIRAGARGVAAGRKNKRGNIAYSVYVRPHPFIMNGWRTARKKLRPMLKQKLEVTLKNV